MISTEICRNRQCMANMKKNQAENVTKEKKNPARTDYGDTEQW